MTSSAGGHGQLSVIVWPVYLGAALGEPGNGTVALGEPYGEPNYQRGQITWTDHGDGVILGSARIYLPKGIWTHLVFCSGWHRDAVMDGGYTQMEHPIVFDRPGILNVDPIRNQDVLPRQGA